jgi:hypothetical protein
MKSNFLYRLGVMAGFMGILSGCTSVTLQPGAERVRVTSIPLAKDCQLLGTVSSEDINGEPAFTAHSTVHAYMQSNEIKDLKNQALKLGANVVLVTQHDFMDFTMPHQNTNVVEKKHHMVGNAYRCS